MPADSSSPFRFASASLAGLQPSATLQINERVQALRAAGRDVLHLGFGESRFPVPATVVAALREHAAERSCALQSLRFTGGILGWQLLQSKW
ncbi:MAG: hypothetical protein DWI63_05050 [Chloroflexi bacterium]|nr:MAG: hypothetical protein DWI63_05050 [Chloroflexota bacterium]